MRTTRRKSQERDDLASDFWSDGAAVLQSSSLESNHEVPRFGERRIWALDALGVPRNARSRMRIHFSRFEGEWNLRAREIAMARLNPAHEVVRDAGLYLKGKPLHPATINARLLGVLRFSRWLEREHPLLSIGDVTQAHLDSFLDPIRANRGASTVKVMITSLRELFDLRLVLTGDVLSFRPWGDVDATKLSGQRAHGELATAPIPPHAWWPILRASWRYIDVFAPDILAAEKELARQSTRRVRYDRGDIEDEFIRWLTADDSYVPVHRSVPDGYRHGLINWHALSMMVSRGGSTGVFAPGNSEGRRRRQRVRDAVATGKISTVVGGLRVETAQVTRRDGSQGPWIDGWDARTIDEQRAALMGACLVLCLALTMMRSSEILSIRKGAITTHYGAPAVRAKLRKLRGRGEDHKWWITEPVVKALRIAESLSTGDYVFSSLKPGSVDFYPGVRIRSFFSVVNRIADSAGLDPIPDINVTPHMFRRTMAIIAGQQPDGEIALGLQLKHVARRALANSTTSGYAATTADWAAEFEHELQESVASKLVAQWSEGSLRGARLAGAGAQKFRAGLEEAAAVASVSPAGPQTGDQRLLRTLLRDEFSTLRWGTVNHCLGVLEQAACLRGVPEDVASHGVMPNRCDPTGCANSVITSEHKAVWVAEEKDLREKLKDRRMAPHHRRQLDGELREVRDVLRRLTDD